MFDVMFYPKRGSPRQGSALSTDPSTGMIRIQLEGDPFPVWVDDSQVSSCKDSRGVLRSTKVVKRKKGKMTATVEARRGEARELRQRAKALGLGPAADEMTREELRAAVAQAEAAETKTTTKKGKKEVPKTKVKQEAPKKRGRPKKVVSETVEEAPKKRGRPKKVVEEVAEAPKKRGRPKKTETVSEAPKRRGRPPKADSEKAKPKTSKPRAQREVDPNNPFREGSNLHLIVPMLIKGGKRQTLAERLAQKIELHPYQNEEYDISDYDKRIFLAADTLERKYGWTVEKTGRGLESGTIRVIPPSANGTSAKTTKAKKGKTAKKVKSKSK